MDMAEIMQGKVRSLQGKNCYAIKAKTEEKTIMIVPCIPMKALLIFQMKKYILKRETILEGEKHDKENFTCGRRL